MKRIVLTTFAAAGLMITGLSAQEIKARQENQQDRLVGDLHREHREYSQVQAGRAAQESQRHSIRSLQSDSERTNQNQPGGVTRCYCDCGAEQWRQGCRHFPATIANSC